MLARAESAAWQGQIQESVQPFYTGAMQKQPAGQFTGQPAEQVTAQSSGQFSAQPAAEIVVQGTKKKQNAE